MKISSQLSRISGPIIDVAEAVYVALSRFFQNGGVRRWGMRIAITVLFIEGAYLGAINIALNLPATQNYINQLHPEKYAFHWSRAWSWYPFHIYARDFSANGQSWAMQWEIDAPEATASLSVLPLLTQTVQISNIRSADAKLRFRPLVFTSPEAEQFKEYFPTITGRDPDAPGGAVPVQSPGWRITYDLASLTGENQIWLGGIKMVLTGEASGVMSKQNRNGPLTISEGEMSAQLGLLEINGQKIASQGSVEGTFEVGPYLPQDNRGFKILQFMDLDADIELPVDSIRFLNAYLRDITGLKVGGKGEIKGHLAFSDGDFTPGTDISVSADDIDIALAPYDAEGSGVVKATVASETPEVLDAAITFQSIEARHSGNVLFSGSDLQLAVTRGTHIQPGDRVERVPYSIAATIPNMSVPDISVYQTFIPGKWKARILGGTGSLEGHANFAQDSLDFDLTLKSENAEVQFEKDAFETGLDFGLKAKGTADETTAKVDVGGTFLHLDDSQVKTKSGDNSDTWQSKLNITEGEGAVDMPGQSDVEAGFVGFWRLFKEKDVKTLLTGADATLKATLAVSDLDWIGTFFKNPYDIGIEQSAEVIADISVTDGHLNTGSKVSMPEKTFQLDILDYVAQGTGGFEIAVIEGGTDPDLQMNANLKDGSFKRKDEETATIEQVTISVMAQSKDVSLKDGGNVTSAELSIPSAKVTDMSVYNAYFPPSSPIQLLSGAADLSAKISMKPETASGFVKLTTNRIESEIDGSRISGVVDVDAKITGGSAQERTFEIDGSVLTLSGLRVSGSSSGNWGARLDINSGKVIWKRPMTLDASTSFSMTDVSPLMAIFETHRKKNKWMDRIFDLKDVRGSATVSVAPKDIVVPYALAKAQNVEVGAKGIFQPGDRQGMYYLRYGNLSALLEFLGDRKKLAVINATKKFEEYKPGGRLPGLTR